MTGTGLRKALIIIILAVFLIITGLTSVMYLMGNNGTPTNNVDSGAVDTGVVTPVVEQQPSQPVQTMTKEQIKKELEKLLSGNKG